MLKHLELLIDGQDHYHTEIIVLMVDLRVINVKQEFVYVLPNNEKYVSWRAGQKNIFILFSANASGEQGWGENMNFNSVAYLIFIIFIWSLGLKIWPFELLNAIEFCAVTDEGLEAATGLTIKLYVALAIYLQYKEEHPSA